MQQSEEDVDTLVRCYNTTSANRRNGDGIVDGDKNTAEGNFPRNQSTPQGRPPGRLSWGDRVQIVSTQNGWAKMARGYGYVRAGAQQLVKGTRETNVC